MVCSKSSKQPFESSELEMILNSVSTNMLLTSKATRQSFLHLNKKMFQRIYGDIVPNTRNECIARTSIIAQRPSRYETFLSQLGQYLFSCFFIGATPIRRSTALELLSMLLNSFIENDESLHLGLICLKQNLCTKENALVLVDCLEDPFEQNKEFALKCLNTFPTNALIGEDEEDKKEYLKHIWKRITVLRHSHKPSETVSAAYILRYVVQRFHDTLSQQLNCNLYEQIPNFVFISKDKQNLCDSLLKTYYLVLDHLVISLKRQITTASRNLIEASENEPMYGTILCIRTIIDLVSEFYLKKDSMNISSNWIVQLIEILIEATNIVASVINNDSPEGHLPMDFTPELKNDGNLTSVKTSSQKLLLCAWRTSKDVSLLLGDISILCYKLSEFPEKDNIALEEVKKRLPDFFCRLLSEIKHRGAFEQAYIGFCQVCSILWKPMHKPYLKGNITDGSLPSPVIMLKEVLGCLKPNSSNINREDGVDNDSDIRISGNCNIKMQELCSTRRSAGIPYLIQGKNM